MDREEGALVLPGRKTGTGLPALLPTLLPDAAGGFLPGRRYSRESLPFHLTSRQIGSSAPALIYALPLFSDGFLSFAQARLRAL